MTSPQPGEVTLEEMPEERFDPADYELVDWQVQGGYLVVIVRERAASEAE